MKKVLQKMSLLCMALIASLSMYAGDNDLLWDYTEAAPTANPAKGLNDALLYYESKVSDAAGTKNGLKGVKLNSSGYAFFAKPAVAGKLSLTIGLRNGTGAFCVDVYKCTIADGKATFTDGAATPADADLIATTDEVQESNAVHVEIPADVTGIYIKRHTGAEGVLSKVVFKETVARNFTDFEITNDQLKVQGYTGSDLPSGVTFSGNDEQADSHGYRNVTITVPVDGTVKFTIGGCQYANRTFSVKNATEEVVGTVDPKTANCYHQDGSVVTYLYVGAATTLTFENIQYLPYFKAEATEVQEATITYKDQNGKELGKKTLYEGDPIGEVPYTEADLTIPSGQKFRGWVYGSKVKVAATDVVTGNTTVSALVTDIESVAVGTVQTYDLTQKTFYPEDHETITITGGSYYNNHGWTMDANGTISVDVAGKAQVVVSECEYGSGTTFTVTDANSNVVAADVNAKAASDADGASQAFQYDGEATTLTLTFASQTFVHKISVYNVEEFPVKDEATGYFIVAPGDAGGLMLAFNEANSTPDTKIFLPDGTYDFGEATSIGLSGTNTSIIGQSTKAIIKNAPPKEKEGLGSADMLLNTGSNLYLQDVTLWNDMSFDGGTGRAAVFHDKGTNTICKNVNMLSYQDTYYSNKVGATYYFEGGELHGVVDFLCGDSKVYFNGCNIVTESIKDATITANSELYVFKNCTITPNGKKYNFGRAWSADGDGPKCVFLNTTLADDGANLLSSRWNPSGINVDYTVAGEYGTMDSKGEVITPASNIVTFAKKSTKLETILDASALETYSIENVLGEWAATAQAAVKQAAAPKATISGNTISITPADGGDTGIYLIEEKNGGFVALVQGDTYVIPELEAGSIDLGITDAVAYTVRAANAMGGFGEAADVTIETGISEVNAENAAAVAEGKIVANGKVLILKNGKKFTAAGAEM